MRSRRDHRKSIAGISLVEVTVGMGLFGALALGMGQYMSNFAGQMNVNQSRNLRMEIAERVRRTAANEAAVRYSAEYGVGNAYLKPCIFQTTTAALSACQETPNYLPFFLYEINNVNSPRQGGGGNTVYPFVPQLDYIAGASAGSSGQQATPRRYRTNGSPCPLGAPASKECPIEVVTEFRIKQRCI